MHVTKYLSSIHHQEKVAFCPPKKKKKKRKTLKYYTNLVHFNLPIIKILIPIYKNVTRVKLKVQICILSLWC